MQWKCEYVYLSTEDKGAVGEFKNIFGSKLIFLEKTLSK